MHGQPLVTDPVGRGGRGEADAAFPSGLGRGGGGTRTALWHDIYRDELQLFRDRGGHNPNSPNPEVDDVFDVSD